jgi:hypothetical protein
VREMVLSEFRKEKVDDFMEEAMKKAGVEMNPDALVQSK